MDTTGATVLATAPTAVSLSTVVAQIASGADPVLAFLVWGLDKGPFFFRLVFDHLSYVHKGSKAVC